MKRLSGLNRFLVTTSGLLRSRFHRQLSSGATMDDSIPQTSDAPPGKQIIVEGTAQMEYDLKEKVFYNKVQVLNRDLSIQVIKLFSEKLVAERRDRYQQKLAKYESLVASSSGESNNADVRIVPPTQPKSGIHILDALAASGLRSIRYLKEIPLVDKVTINDLSEEATKLAQENCMRNNIDMNRVNINTQDATMFMYGKRNPLDHFDVIDLDPYGTAVPFLDSAVQSVADGGLLCVTCTDMTVLSGSYPEVTFYKYHSMPVRGKYLHEMALRILLHSIDSTANMYKRHIVPWLALSVDFYVRVFVRVYDSPAEVKNTCLKRAMVFQSLQCPTFYVQSMGSHNKTKSNYTAPILTVPTVCADSGGRMKMGGPYWSDPIHDQTVVDELLQRVKSTINNQDPLHPVPTAPRLSGILTIMSEELKDVPFYYSLPELASTLHCKVPTYQEFQAALNNANYRLSQFHHDANAVKTDAPNDFVSYAPCLYLILPYRFLLSLSLSLPCRSGIS
jgi:tRNA (guanine26-N2/guanine27-N2)-dimethyltransferase